MEVLWRQLTELKADEMTDVDDSRESSGQSSEDEEEQEPICVAPRRRGTWKNVAQQSATLAIFKGDDSSDGPTIKDWFNEFDTLATVYR